MIQRFVRGAGSYATITEFNLRVSRVVEQLAYKNWKFILEHRPGSFLTLVVEFDAPDNDNPGLLETQRSRSWLLTPEMTNDEIVRTALLAVLTAEEHETRELFTYRGAAPFQPHQAHAAV